ncbi:hypothetical protein P0M11_07260 [Kaistella sp. PBT33-4]|uniref:hypothetical protein n=1 Tax=Kaistella sp. PBT33-4 TaxID=3032000 RepID=UPI0023D84E20|nr:hypothetical protein [Kaistella sp. PBT33-4]MDF0719798.1 hypothetical protein [Kaistella sp. PBT33-4]
MLLLELIFQKPNIQCPRCLGKGNVDDQDIARLRKQLFWQPGKCAFCNGKGKTYEAVINQIPEGLSYLHCHLSAIERWRLINGNKNAFERAKEYEELVKNLAYSFAKQYYDEGADVRKIAETYFSEVAKTKANDEEKNNLARYIDKVVEFYKDELI